MTTEREIDFIKRAIREIIFEVDKNYQEDQIALEVLITLICNRLVELNIKFDCWDEK